MKPDPSIREPDLTLVAKLYEEFHLAYGVCNGQEAVRLYTKLLEEEHEEWIEAYYSMEVPEYEELKELADVLYVTLGLAYGLEYKLTKAEKFSPREYYDYSITDIISEVASGKYDRSTISQLIYCLFGYADAMGWDLLEAFKRVHASNMSKLGEDGKPIRRADGKVLKGPNYTLPDLEDLTDGK